MVNFSFIYLTHAHAYIHTYTHTAGSTEGGGQNATFGV